MRERRDRRERRQPRTVIDGNVLRRGDLAVVLTETLRWPANGAPKFRGHALRRGEGVFLEHGSWVFHRPDWIAQPFASMPPAMQQDIAEAIVNEVERLERKGLRIPRERRRAPVRDTTHTFTPHDQTSSGYISSRDSTANYSNAREGLADIYVYDDLSIHDSQYTGEVYSSSFTRYECFESFQQFDTSSLAGLTVDSVDFSVVPTTSNTHPARLLEVRLLDWGGSLVPGDFVAGSGLAALLLLASYDTDNGWFTSARMHFPDLPAFAANINLAGITRFMVSSSWHRLGTPPTSGTERYLNRSPTRATDYPQLVVETAAPAGGAAAMMGL